MAVLVSCNKEQIIVQSISLNAIEITPVYAIIKGEIKANSLPSNLSYGVLFSSRQDDLPSNAIRVEAVDRNPDMSFSIRLNHLQPETTYYYQSYCSLDGVDSYGRVNTFTTTRPTVVTFSPVIDYSRSTIILKGSYDGDDAISFGFAFNTSNIISENSWKLLLSRSRYEVDDNGVFSGEIWTSNFTPEEPYFCAFIVNDKNERVFGNVLSLNL
jgi:hypothetical protein